MGGSWERLVKAVKIALYDALPSRTPTDPLLRSCLISAENIVNSRPLTYLPLDSEESEVLTPNHFLVGCSNGDKTMAKLDNDAKIVTPITANPSLLFALKKYFPYVDVNVTSEEAHSSEKNENYVVPSVSGSAEKRLLIQTVKDRQELKEKQIEIEIRKKILQLEHELKKEAELVAAAENDDTNRSVSSKVSKIDKHYLVADWIKNINVVEPSIDNIPQIIPTVGQPRDDINCLCQTISIVINEVLLSGNDKLFARHIVDEDFSTFDENPEDWPSFHQ
ncbi:hypothetical protein JTB14_016575 [Gonioctena quinquepunctata]|nr:hypothetical protein JTB14_016575 [Gonioctena quinquepunctata]